MVDDGGVTANAAAGLLDKLDAVADDLAKGKSKPAHNKLTAFVREVESLVKDGRIAADHAQVLIDAANALVAAI
jgi:hypothetical protein